MYGTMALCQLNLTMMICRRILTQGVSKGLHALLSHVALYGSRLNLYGRIAHTE